MAVWQIPKSWAISKVRAPKRDKASVGTYQPAELDVIQAAAEQEPIKWHFAIHLLMVTGCRRGELIGVLQEYRIWQDAMRQTCEGRWEDTPYILTGEFGGHMAPDTLSGYLKRFGEKYDLPHIHAHKFRHTMASILYYAGMDSVSISKRLGHAQVSTTLNIYGHLIEKADTQAANHIANAFFRGKPFRT